MSQCLFWAGLNIIQSSAGFQPYILWNIPQIGYRGLRFLWWDHASSSPTPQRSHSWSFLSLLRIPRWWAFVWAFPLLRWSQSSRASQMSPSRGFSRYLPSPCRTRFWWSWHLFQILPWYLWDDSLREQWDHRCGSSDYGGPSDIVLRLHQDHDRTSEE